ncbi:hypothetical protein AD428_10720 [Achromobacter sp. DMS1]|nr:hypothetical protein AD428_10720 [Achromobacter sp. DMS1]
MGIEQHGGQGGIFHPVGQQEGRAVRGRVFGDAAGEAQPFEARRHGFAQIGIQRGALGGVLAFAAVSHQAGQFALQGAAIGLRDGAGDGGLAGGARNCC